MTPVFTNFSGDTPLLISVPHDGRQLPADVASRMTPVGKSIPDTDWHVAELYNFAQGLGASMIVANYSRYVVDLNRPADDRALYDGQVATGICPARSFAGEALYVDDRVIGQDEQQRRILDYWAPYHAQIAAELDALRQQHGYALLWDAHSIPSRVPRLFDGELPVLNVGTYDDASCAPALSAAVYDVAQASRFSAVRNARFKGGFITRHYGDPANDVHAIQLEIAQRAYMDETSLALDAQKTRVLQDVLREMLAAFAESARKSGR